MNTPSPSHNKDSFNTLLTELPSFPLKTNQPWLIGGLGALQLLAGIVLLSYPLFTGLSVIWITGFVLIFMAVIQFAQLFSSAKSGRLWSIISMILYALVAIFMITEPLQAMSIWTLAIGLYLIIAALGRCSLALSVRGTRGWGLALFSGLVTLTLGGIVTFQWPGSSTWLIGTVIAIELMMNGWMLLILSLNSKALKSAKKED